MFAIIYKTKEEEIMGRTKEQIAKYNHSEKGRACQKRYKKSKKGKVATNATRRKYKIKIRNKVIEMYTDGRNLCMACCLDVKHLHHTNPEDGLREKEMFGSNTSVEARVYQIRMYETNPSYIQPLCIECHKIEHRRLRGEKKHGKEMDHAKSLSSSISGEPGEL